jgi:NAD(P)-dependent dehydrogenase (short-subunit alcohol dehydrogenase family)
VDLWIEKTIQHFGRLNGAANLAGVIGKNLGRTPVAEQDEDDWNFVLGINLTGLIHAAYAASKHGVIELTRSAAKELEKASRE